MYVSFKGSSFENNPASLNFLFKHLLVTEAIYSGPPPPALRRRSSAAASDSSEAASGSV